MSIITEAEVDSFWEVIIEYYGEERILEKFESKAQLRFLFSKHPKVAQKWMGKHRKGEIERLPNRKHPRKPGVRVHKVDNKYKNNDSVRNALKSLGNR